MLFEPDWTKEKHQMIALGDQKIDVLIDGGLQNNTIFKTEANDGILL